MREGSHPVLALLLFGFCLVWANVAVSIAESLLRAMGKGLRKGAFTYARLVALRDTRVFVAMVLLLMAWIILRGGEGRAPTTLPWWAYVAFLIVPLQLLVRAIAPPDVLLLHSFSPETYAFAKLLSRGLGPLSLVSLAEPFGRIAGQHALLGELAATGTFADRAAGGVGTKTAGDDWPDVVKGYMELTDAIVVDVSDARSGVLAEIEHLTTKRDLLAKTTFVCRDGDAARTAVALLRERVPENIDCYCYGQLVVADPLGGPPRILQSVFDQWLWTGFVGQRLLARTGARRRRGGRLALSLIVALVLSAAIHARL